MKIAFNWGKDIKRKKILKQIVSLSLSRTSSQIHLHLINVHLKIFFAFINIHTLNRRRFHLFIIHVRSSTLLCQIWKTKKLLIFISMWMPNQRCFFSPYFLFFYQCANEKLKKYTDSNWNICRNTKKKIKEKKERKFIVENCVHDCCW